MSMHRITFFGEALMTHPNHPPLSVLSAALPHPVRSPRGTAITCKNWLIEAAYRMLQNNLDPDVAENPDAMEIGRAHV